MPASSIRRGGLLEMLQRFAAVHVVPALADKQRRARILRRDGWMCTMPHCRNQRNLEAHHIQDRSRGGGHQGWNLTTLCHRCHRLEHAGHVRLLREGHLDLAAGQVPLLTVRMGRVVNGSRHSGQWFREGLRVHGMLPQPRFTLARRWASASRRIRARDAVQELRSGRAAAGIAALDGERAVGCDADVQRIGA